MRTEHIEKIKEIVEEIKVAMLVTAESDDKINSRPMHTQEVDQFGNIWFFTSLGTGKIGDIAENTTVNLAYASPDKNTFLSVTGKSQGSTGPQKNGRALQQNARCMVSQRT